MRWGWFAVALLLTYVLQTALAPQSLDLLLSLALVVGLVAPVPEAWLAGWLTGFMADLGDHAQDQVGRLGLHAFTFGLLVLALTWLREYMNRGLWWVRWLAAFLVALPAEYLLKLHQRVLQGAHIPPTRFLLEPLLLAALASLVAAIVVAVPTVVARRRRMARRW